MIIIDSIGLLFIQFCSACSIFINVFLIPLIWFRSSPEIGTYRFLLLSYSCVTLGFASISFFAVPVFAPSNSGWIMFSTVNLLPQSIGSCLNVLLCGCYSVQIAVITLSFLYRYLVVCRPSQLTWFHRPAKLLQLVLISSTFCLLWTGVTAIFLYPTDHLNEVFRDLVFTVTKQKIEKVAYIAGVAYDKMTLQWEYVFIFSCRVFIISVSTGIIIFCVFGILKKFRGYTRLSSRKDQMVRVHRKLFILLQVQTFVPLFLVYLPAVCSYLFGFLQISNPKLTVLFSVALPLAQMIDPLLIIFIISDYRKTVLEIFYRRETRKRTDNCQLEELCAISSDRSTSPRTSTTKISGTTAL